MADVYDDDDFYTTPPQGWECAKDWARAARDPLLAEAVRLEPDLLKVLELARRSRRIPGYNRIRRYYDLKPLGGLYVGDDALLDVLGTPSHFDAMIQAISALLPADRSDDSDLLLERGDDGVQAILATRPILPTPPRPKFMSADYLFEHEDEFEAEARARRASDRAWIRALQITPDPVLMAPFTSPS